MTEHHAFRLAGRPGGVNDGGELAGGDRSSPVTELLAGAPLRLHLLVTAALHFLETEDGRLRRGRFVHDGDGLECGQEVPDVLNLLELKPRRDDGKAGAGVFENVARQSGRERRIDRHRHRAERQDRQVAQHPLRPALGDDRDTVAGTDAQRFEPETELANPLEHFLAREPFDDTAPAAAHEHRLGKPAHEMERQVGDGLDVRDGFAHRRDYTCVLVTTSHVPRAMCYVTD